MSQENLAGRKGRMRSQYLLSEKFKESICRLKLKSLLSEIKEGTYVQNRCMVKEVNMRNIRISMNCFCQQQQKTYFSGECSGYKGALYIQTMAK